MNERICPHCGGVHPEEANFCPLTGKTILTKRTCPNCNGEIEEDWNVCGHCGHPLNSSHEINQPANTENELAQEHENHELEKVRGTEPAIETELGDFENDADIPVAANTLQSNKFSSQLNMVSDPLLQIKNAERKGLIRGILGTLIVLFILGLLFSILLFFTGDYLLKSLGIEMLINW